MYILLSFLSVLLGRMLYSVLRIMNALLSDP